jgi:uncharacterized membrane protein
MEGVSLFWHLLLGTVLHRPYVYAFFVCFLGFAALIFGTRKTALYLVLAFLVALASELSSTRWGFPFGMYVYNDSMRTQELWISNVPSWDSLSFVFLSFFSWILAGAICAKSLKASDIATSLRAWPTLLLGGFLMMALDLVIDPLTLLGDRWFLGHIYYYPEPGPYFGVTLANFAGWWFLGSFIPWLYLRLVRLDLRELPVLYYWGVFGVYAGVFAFNLGITVFVREWKLLAASSCIAFVILAFGALSLRKRSQSHVS